MRDVRDPSEIPVADVIALYAKDKADDVSRPKEAARRLKNLLAFFGSKMLDQVNGAGCREYVKQSSSKSSARRELADLSSAINHHRREGLCSQIVSVVLPEKETPRERWLTRSEAARHILHCWKFREVRGGKRTDRRARQHIAKFIVVSLYTGTRAGAVCGAALGEPMPGRGWVDLENGVFYRKPPRKRKTNKRQPSIRLPDRLLAHLRRWHRNGQRFVVEFDRGPVKTVYQGFKRSAKAVGLGPDVIPHTLRHSAITWAMQRSVDPYVASGYFGVSMKVLLEVYGHHHPDFQESVRKGFDRPARQASTR